jgi:hypothetical protein
MRAVRIVVLTKGRQLSFQITGVPEEELVK